MRYLPLILLLIIISCKETTNTYNATDFDCLCPAMEKKDFEEAKNCINDYIRFLNPKYDPDDLHMGYEKDCIKVDEWLDEQECVVKS